MSTTILMWSAAEPCARDRARASRTCRDLAVDLIQASADRFQPPGKPAAWKRRRALPTSPPQGLQRIFQPLLRCLGQQGDWPAVGRDYQFLLGGQRLPYVCRSTAHTPERSRSASSSGLLCLHDSVRNRVTPRVGQDPYLEGAWTVTMHCTGDRRAREQRHVQRVGGGVAWRLRSGGHGCGGKAGHPIRPDCASRQAGDAHQPMTAKETVRAFPDRLPEDCSLGDVPYAACLRCRSVQTGGQPARDGGSCSRMPTSA